MKIKFVYWKADAKENEILNSEWHCAKMWRRHEENDAGIQNRMRAPNTCDDRAKVESDR